LIQVWHDSRPGLWCCDRLHAGCRGTAGGARPQSQTQRARAWRHRHVRRGVGALDCVVVCCSHTRSVGGRPRDRRIASPPVCTLTRFTGTLKMSHFSLVLWKCGRLPLRGGFQQPEKERADRCVWQVSCRLHATFAFASAAVLRASAVKIGFVKVYGLHCMHGFIPPRWRRRSIGDYNSNYRCILARITIALLIVINDLLGAAWLHHLCQSTTCKWSTTFKPSRCSTRLHQCVLLFFATDVLHRVSCACRGWVAKKDRSYATCTRGCVRARSLSRSYRRIAVWLNANVCFAQVRVVECFFEGLEQWPAGCKLFVHVSSVSLMRTQRSRRCLQAPTMVRWSCVCSSDGCPQPGPAECPLKHARSKGWTCVGQARAGGMKWVYRTTTSLLHCKEQCPRLRKWQSFLGMGYYQHTIHLSLMRAKPRSKLTILSLSCAETKSWRKTIASLQLTGYGHNYRTRLSRPL